MVKALRILVVRARAKIHVFGIFFLRLKTVGVGLKIGPISVAYKQLISFRIFLTLTQKQSTFSLISLVFSLQTNSVITVPSKA